MTLTPREHQSLCVTTYCHSRRAISADRYGQMLAGGHDGRRPEPVVLRFGHLPTGRTGPGRLLTPLPSVSATILIASRAAVAGCWAGVTCCREPTGFAPALKGVAGEAVAAARRRSGFPTDWRSTRGGWSARWMPRWSREPTASPAAEASSRAGRSAPSALCSPAPGGSANSSHPNTTGHQLLVTVQGYRVKGS